MLIQSFTLPTAGRHAPTRSCAAVSSAMATSKSTGCGGGFATISDCGRKLYFSSMPSWFQTVTSLPSCLRQRAMAISQPSASPSGRTWLITTKRWCSFRARAISARLQLFFVIGNLDLLEKIDDARAALERLVEFEMELRGVFQNHAF